MNARPVTRGRSFGATLVGLSSSGLYQKFYPKCAAAFLSKNIGKTIESLVVCYTSCQWFCALASLELAANNGDIAEKKMEKQDTHKLQCCCCWLNKDGAAS